jgi:aconitate hydratase
VGEDVAGAGSKVVTEYLRAGRLTEHLEALGFHLVGYGCTTCIGNSGPLPARSPRGQRGDLAVCSVLSGNRNFEGRINPDVKMNYLASPPLSCLRAGRHDGLGPSTSRSAGTRRRRRLPHDIWPSSEEVAARRRGRRALGDVRDSYGEVFEGDERWKGSTCPTATASRGTRSRPTCAPPFLEDLPREPEPVAEISGARALAILGDSVTTDHISPAGAIKKGGPAANYLEEHGVEAKEFNSYGSRRGNHEVMMRGTFANIRLRNRLARGPRGRHPVPGR